MNVLVVGGHGKIGLRLLKLLAARGDRARGTIRSADQAADLEAVGAEPVSFDLEAEDAERLAIELEGADAAVFAAGAGPGSGAERKRAVDLGGATKLIDACHRAGVTRYLMISAMGVDRHDHPAEMEPYYEAKREADAALRASGLEHTIVRPGRLTDEPGNDTIEVGIPLEHYGEIPRDDVAATLVAVLDQPHTIDLTFDVVSGDVEIGEAIGSLLPEPGSG